MNSEVTSAAILVGGEGRRLGGVAKHRLAFGDGETLLARLARLLADEVGGVTLISRRPVDTALPVVLDTFSERGAAAGVHAALHHAPAGWVFVSACDLPCLDAATIRTLSAARSTQDVVLARAGGQLQPLAAFWHTRALPKLVGALSEGALSLRALVGRLDATLVEFTEAAPFTNVNLPEDMAALGLTLTPTTSSRTA